MFIFIIIPSGILIGAYIYFSHDLPHLSSLKDYHPKLVTKIYSSSGDLIGEFFTERRYITPLEEIPKKLQAAFISAEDDQFFTHEGVDLLSIIRAAYKDLEAMEIKQGGSTITQQVVKSFFLTPEKSLTRKIKEILLASRIEKYLTKEDILFLYLNQIYLGHGAYGVAAAVKTYFNKSMDELNMAEMTLVAGLAPAPNAFSPINHFDRAKKRQKYVLKRMQEIGIITEEEMAEAIKTPLVINPAERGKTKLAPYFIEHIRRYLEKKYGEKVLYTGGLKVFTTLDINMQKAANSAVEKGLESYETRHSEDYAKDISITEEPPKAERLKIQGALVCIDPYNGHIKALVGGRSFSESKFNRAINANRQPGSAFKPIIYSAAMDRKYTPSTIIIDSPIIFENSEDRVLWEPLNYDRTFLGPTGIRCALSKSRNVVTVKILQDIGIDYVINYAHRMGINSTLNPDLSLALGSSGVSLLELTSAYGIFPAKGNKATPMFITKIFDCNGNVLEENHPKIDEIISPQTAYIITSLLESVIKEGTGRKMQALKRPCAGKTGTSNEYRDAWFIGFTPKLLAGVWVGFDDNSPLGEKETGAAAAAPIWLSFMQEALKGRKIFPFKVSDGIVFVKIDPKTGTLPTSESKDKIFECYREGTEPISFEPEKEGKPIIEEEIFSKPIE
ncbi:MAG: PBP1A family penicillin-binding protein [Thermodesulfobacteriota bacterium]|nr:PBP1A family penicillin-binding protein [Thermodesulfobacteriota bacterium]